MTLVLVTPPAVEPVSLDELKAHLRINADQNDEDALLQHYLTTARKYAENYTWRAFITQTWRVSFDCFPCKIEAPRPPLQEVTSLQYVDTAGDTQTLDEDLYQVDADSQPGRIIPAYGQSWPSIRSGTLNAATVTFEAGYGDSPDDVPEEIRQSILFLAAHLYEQREAVVIGAGISIETVPFAVESLLGMHSMRGF